MPNLEARTARRIRAKQQHANEIKQLLAVGLNQIVSELGGQLAAVEFSKALWGKGLNQGAISKAINHFTNLERIHLQFCQLLEDLDHRSAMGTASIIISNKIGTLPRFHSVLKVKSRGCFCLYLDCYQNDNNTFVIVIDKKGEERHVDIDDIEII